MGFSNFFKRKSILPGALRPARGAANSQSEQEDSELFLRPTLAAPGAPDDQSLEDLRAFFGRERATERPRAEINERQTSPSPEPTSGGALQSETATGGETRIDRDAAADWDTDTEVDLELRSGGRTGLVSAGLSSAGLGSAGLEQRGDALFRTTATGRTFATFPAAIDETLGFVDAQPRYTLPPSPTQAPQATPMLLRSPAASLAELYALGDFSGALEAADTILQVNATDAVALRYREDARRVLLKMCEARLSPMTRRPVLLVGDEQLRWLSLDHREGFLLSLVDGHSSLDELVDVSGMDPLEALRSLTGFLDKGIITLK